MADKDLQMKERVAGSSHNLYPITKAANVSVSRANNTNIPSGDTKIQDVMDDLGAMAFDDGDSLVYLGGGEQQYNGNLPESEINDTTASATTTWSSAKLKALFELLGVTFDSNMNGTVS